METQPSAGSKTFLKSKTIWGGALAVLPFVWQTLDMEPLFTAEQVAPWMEQAFLMVQQAVAFFLIVKGRIDAAKDPRKIAVKGKAA